MSIICLTSTRIMLLSTPIVLLVVAYMQLALSSNQNSLHGIAYISVTTDNMTASTQFYTQVLGGMLVPELTFTFSGDSHYYRMFQKEILDARTQGVDPAQLGVPDIRDNGTHEVHGNFIIFDNGIIQLVEYVLKASTDTIFDMRDRRSCSAYIGAQMVCFWVKDDVDFNHYIAEMERKSRDLGLDQIKVNRPVTVHNEAERLAVPENELDVTFNTGVFDGLSMAYFKGPSGERLELNQIVRRYKYYLGSEFCRRRAVTTAFLDHHPDNKWKKAAGVSGQLYGIYELATRTDDLLMSNDFYTQVLGADLVPKPLVGVDFRGDDVENMVFQKEILDAESWGVDPKQIGVPNISMAGDDRRDLNFNLFDNYVVKTVQYTAGRSLSDPRFNPRYNWSSPAYINNMNMAFFVDSNVDLNNFLQSAEKKAAGKRFPQFKLNRAVDVQTLGASVPAAQYSEEFTDGPLKGFNYVYAKGPAGEQISFVQFKGPAEAKLKSALLKYSAVNTAFKETNPWVRKEYDSFCSKYSTDPNIG
ncbi:uncharacterized protein LOC124292035 [Haliotis rubra]|uniref:uncharacterized protein LOC124292035 n=1 Tax=Haliotis rubra TaxID=36100 RepID=UPI001EE5D8BE|nr:uncharacterized protein LOC124292035 [Haliotis rubra]